MKKVVEDEIEEKLKYLGLDLNNVPETLKIFEPLNYRITKKYEENRYRQYRFVPIKDIEILLTPTNRLNSIEEKYSKASPIYSYLVPDSEENILKHATFLQMLKKVKIEDIENIEAEQKQLANKIPFKVVKPITYILIIFFIFNTLMTIAGIKIFINRTIENHNLNVYVEEYEFTKKNNFISSVYKFLSDKIFTDSKMAKVFPNINIKDMNGNIIYLKQVVEN